MKLAIIGGSGLYNIEGVEFVKDHELSTPYGSPSGAIREFSLGEHHFYFLARHGQGHRIGPSEINYQANIYALKSIGVDTLLSVSAVGSLKEEYAPKTFVFPHQFVDWTKGLRKRSFFHDGMVGHVSNADPVNKEISDIVYNVASELDIKSFSGGTYICIEGPQFSTRAESELYRKWGMDIIGMTNVPEAFLAKEAGITYVPVSMVTDYDCWKEEAVTLEEIMETMKTNNINAQRLIKETVPKLLSSKVNLLRENQNAVVTQKEKLSPSHQKILENLIGR